MQNTEALLQNTKPTMRSTYAKKYSSYGALAGGVAGGGLGVLATFASAAALVTGTGLAVVAAHAFFPLLALTMGTVGIVMLAQKSWFIRAGGVLGYLPISATAALKAAGSKLTIPGLTSTVTGMAAIPTIKVSFCAMGGMIIGGGIGWAIGKTRDMSVSPKPA